MPLSDANLSFAHFNLCNTQAYQAWRDAKLAPYPYSINQHMVTINCYDALTHSELLEFDQSCKIFNFALYDIGLTDTDSEIPQKIVAQLGLSISDKHLCGDKVGISAIEVIEKRSSGEYIPYTNKSLNWHTDGYYNKSEQKILSMILHCAQNANVGGQNAFFDHEVIYILLRDENPEYIAALMQDDALTIPENVQGKRIIREAQTGPVFSMHDWGLHMRYTARTKSILWKKDPILNQAVKKIREILEFDSIYLTKFTFNPGQGMISHNVLHMRTAFENSTDSNKQRLLYRMRFYERMSIR